MKRGARIDARTCARTGAKIGVMTTRGNGVAEEGVITAESKDEIVVRTDAKRDVKTETTTVNKI